jgi:hypothetical protein
MVLAVWLTVIWGCEERYEKYSNLRLACQLTECVCKRQKKSIFDDSPPEAVLWAKNGDAYCPEGSFLSRVEKDD